MDPIGRCWTRPADRPQVRTRSRPLDWGPHRKGPWMSPFRPRTPSRRSDALRPGNGEVIVPGKYTRWPESGTRPLLAMRPAPLPPPGVARRRMARWGRPRTATGRLAGRFHGRPVGTARAESPGWPGRSGLRPGAKQRHGPEDAPKPAATP